MDPALKAMYEKQGYAIVGRHSAVKTCHWLHDSIMGGRVCYKEQFFGIRSHRCLQMTPVADRCTHSCLFCWRYQGFEGRGDEWDDPTDIVNGTIEAQRKLVSGFKGDARCDPKVWEEARNPNQVAISLTGEPTLYPYLGELIGEYKRKGFTTFLVTNGTMPEVIRDLTPLPTQLYVSIVAPNKEIYRSLCRPKQENGWERIMETLSILPSLDTRKVARHTLVKGHNLGFEEEYASLDRIADPDFIEPKGYVHVGYSRERLGIPNMPSMDEMRAFANRMAELTGHKLVGESPVSRVVLLSNGRKEMMLG